MSIAMWLTLIPILVQVTFSVIIKVQGITKMFLRWHENNHMKVNPGKSHIVLSSNIQIIVPFDNVAIISSFTKNLIATTFNLELKF